MRFIAQIVAARQPAYFSVHGIDDGDALALATRTAFDYAYRGRQALYWGPAFTARKVHDAHRELLHVNGIVLFAGVQLALLAAQFSQDRAARVRELRFVRNALRKIKRAALLFAAGVVSGEVGFGDLGFAVCGYGPGALIAARDFPVNASIFKV